MYEQNFPTTVFLGPEKTLPNANSFDEETDSEFDCASPESESEALHQFIDIPQLAGDIGQGPGWVQPPGIQGMKSIKLFVPVLTFSLLVTHQPQLVPEVTVALMATDVHNHTSTQATHSGSTIEQTPHSPISVLAYDLDLEQENVVEGQRRDQGRLISS